MSTNKAIIAYETEVVATDEIVGKIVDILRKKYQLEIDLVDLKSRNILTWCSFRT